VVKQSQKNKDREKMYKELVSEYQREGYNVKQARKFATEDVNEFLLEDKILSAHKFKRKK
jgi:phosphotransacetylase